MFRDIGTWRIRGERSMRAYGVLSFEFRALSLEFWD